MYLTTSTLLYGNRTYTEDNYVADNEILTSSIDALDIALNDVETGVTGLWRDAGTYIFANNANQVAILDTGYMGIGTSAPSYLLDVGGSLNTSFLWIAGTEVTSSASELNILDGATVTTNEVNYLDGTTVTSGGITFGNGTFITQDVPNIFWNDTSNRLGIGTSAPQYTLDVQGDIAIASGSDLLIDRGAGYIGIGDSASATTSGAFLIGVFDEFNNTDATNLQAVLNDFDAAMGRDLPNGRTPDLSHI